MTERYISLILPVLTLISIFFILESFNKRNPLFSVLLFLIGLFSVFLYAELDVLAEFVLFFSLFIFSYRLERDTNVFQTLLLVVLCFLIKLLSQFLIDAVLRWYWGTNLLHFYAQQNATIIISCLTLCVSLVFAYCFVTFLLPIISQNNLTPVISCVLIVTWLGNISLNPQLHIPENKLSIVVFCLIFTMILILTVKVFFDNQQLEKKEMERTAKETILNNYVDEINRQYQTMRSFQHDYVNILSTTKLYIDQNDMEGLKTIYTKVLAQSMLSMDARALRLNDLQKIESDVLKSILYTKIIEAQGKGIRVEIEVPEPINITIHHQEIALIRILGIIFDNAIEELAQLHYGKLSFASYRKASATYFIIENTVRDNMPSVSVLQKNGYSTKGDSRGIGLATLSQLKKDIDNLYIETSIENNTFMQKLTLVDEVT